MWRKKGVEPVSERTTKELRFILEGIKEGRLEHKQSTYHCGTAHCIAGWKTVLDYKATNQKKSFFTVNPKYDSPVQDVWSDDAVLMEFMQRSAVCATQEFDYAQVSWGLNNDEAHTLFKGNATIKQQFKVLEKLENGYRFIEKSDF